MSNKTIIKSYGTHPINIVVGIFSILVSWYFKKSVFHAICAYLFSWFYLLICLLKGKFADGGFMEIINNYIG